MKTIGFMLSGLGLSGGVYIVLRWANLLTAHGHLVYVIVPAGSKLNKVPFLSDEQLTFPILSHEEAVGIRFDVLFASWWETLTHLPEFDATSYVFFAQALESQFYETGAPEQDHYTRLVRSEISILSIAHWLSDGFEQLGVPRSMIRTVLNPLDHDHWRPTAPLIPKNGQVRFLLEGPSCDGRKNVARALELLEAARVPYIWVGAVVDRKLAGPHCLKVLEAVPYQEMPAVYASADVLVKLSNAEGMFGPPLEMFAMGGTAIAWDVWGAEEYMTHLHNCWLAPMNSTAEALRAIETLRDDPALVARLKANALATAAGWPDWTEAAPAILDTVNSIGPSTNHRLFREVARVLGQRQRLRDLAAQAPIRSS